MMLTVLKAGRPPETRKGVYASPVLSDYHAVSHVMLRGYYEMRDLLPIEQQAQLQKFGKTLERREIQRRKHDKAS